MSSDLAKRLLKKNRKHAGTIVADLDGEAVELTVIKPTVGDRLRVIDEARQAGELGENGEPKGQREQIMLGARVVKALVFKDGAPVFAGTELQEIIDWPDFEDVAKSCADAFAGDGLAKK